VSALNASRASGYPRLAVHGNEVIVAWTEASGGATQVQTAIAQLPASR
jgi:hypothetical protein